MPKSCSAQLGQPPPTGSHPARPSHARRRAPRPQPRSPSCVHLRLHPSTRRPPPDGPHPIDHPPTRRTGPPRPQPRSRSHPRPTPSTDSQASRLPPGHVPPGHPTRDRRTGPLHATPHIPIDRLPTRASEPPWPPPRGPGQPRPRALPPTTDLDLDSQMTRALPRTRPHAARYRRVRQRPAPTTTSGGVVEQADA